MPDGSLDRAVTLHAMTSIASPAAVEQFVRGFAGSPAVITWGTSRAPVSITYINVKAAVIDRFGVLSFAEHKNLVQSLLASLAGGADGQADPPPPPPPPLPTRAAA